MDRISELLQVVMIATLSLVGVALGVVIADAGIRYMYQHRVTEYGIEIMLFGKFPIKRIPFSNIVEIRKASLKEIFSPESLLTSLRFGLYRIGGVCVLLRLREGICIFPFPNLLKRKTLLLFPDNADGFIEQVLSRL